MGSSTLSYTFVPDQIFPTCETTDHIMLVQGVGSSSSPIVISDDEDEALIDLQLRVDSYSVDDDQSDRLCTSPNSNSEELSTESKGYNMALNMGYRPGRGLGRGLDGRVEPVCLEVGLKRKRVDSGIGFQRSQHCTPSWPLRKGDGKLNMKRRKEQHTLGNPPRNFRSQKNYALQPRSLTAPTGPAKANQGPWAALASSSKGKEREHLTAQPAPSGSMPNSLWRLPIPPQGPRSILPYGPPLPPASPPKGPRSWLASQAQSPPLAPQTPPIAPRTPPTAPRAMQQQQHQPTNNGYTGPSAIASPVPQPGYHQTQIHPGNIYGDGKSIPPQCSFPQMQQQQPSQGAIYNVPFAGGPVIYHTAPELYEPWQTQYSLNVATPPPPPTCFIAYPDYSNPGAYTYVPVPVMPTGYAPVSAAIDLHAVTVATATATGQTLSAVGPSAASISVTGSSQRDGHQPISASTPDDDDDDNHSDFSMPESSSSKRLLAERMRKPGFIVPIGHAPETDPSSKMGTYAKTLVPQPNPACTLVLDSIPTRFRNPSWVHKWALNAGEAEPVCVDVDTRNGKALVEFVGAASARKAFQSKQLKGKGKHAIRAWWYRVTGVGSNAGVGEIEEGEVEDGSTKKSELIARLSKSQKRKLRQKQQVAQNLQGGSSGAQVTASVDAIVNQKAHAPSTEQEEASVVAAARHRREFSLDDFSVRFDVSSCAQDGVGVDRFIQDDNEDRLSIASSQFSSGPLVVSHSDRDEDISTPVVTSRTPGDPLSASAPSSVDTDVDSAVTSVSADNGPVSALDSGDARFPQQDINPVDVLVMALTPPHSEPAVCSDSHLHSAPTDIQLSPSCTEAPDEKFVERSPSARLPSLAQEEKFEENWDSNKSASIMGEVDVVNALVPTSTISSSPLRSTPLAREPSADKIALEMNLRRLVRESKQNKANTRSATASPTSIHPTPLPTAPSAIDDDVVVAQPSHAVSPATLEDLAVSFISETIEGIKPTVLNTTAPMNARHELLQKQLKLERHISQSKELIARLSRAQSKEEKEDIMCEMREWSRRMEMDSVGVERKSPVVASRFCWPCSCEEILLVISDDEDED